MKKNKPSKMCLNRETLKRLSDGEVRRVAAGLQVVSQHLAACFPSGDAAGCLVTQTPDCYPWPD